MLPIFAAAASKRPRIAYGEGEDERVLRAIQTVLDEGLARPVIVARREVVEHRIARLSLRWQLDRDVEIVDPMAGGELLASLVEPYRALVARRGVPVAEVQRTIYRRPTVTAAMLLRTGHVDAALVGGNSEWWSQMKLVLQVIPHAAGTKVYALSGLIVDAGAVFMADTHMVPDPTAEEIAEMTMLAAAQMRGFGIEPKAALLSHSNFGASETKSARKMRAALALLRARNVDFAVDGEMHADSALSEPLRSRLVADSPLTGAANLMVMPNLDAANITLGALAAAAGGLVVGPMLMGFDRPIHTLVPTVTARGIVNLTAIAAAAA